MDIKEIFEALDKSELENKKELKDSVSKIISTKNDEAKQHRTKFEAANAMITEFKEFVNVPSDIPDDGLSDFLYEKKLTGDQSSKDLSKLQRQMTKMEKTLDEERKEKETLKRDALTSKRDSEINSILASNNVVPTAVKGLSQMFKSNAKYDNDEWTIDGGDLETGIKNYLDENPYVLSAGQKAGAGTKAIKSGGEPKKDHYSYAEIKAMTPAERKKNSKAIAASNGRSEYRS